MPATIVDNQTLLSEVVLSERVATTEFKVVEIQENITQRYVRAEIELGPFTTVEMPNGETVTRGTSRRGVTVWENAEYDAIRDTWANGDLITAIIAKLG